MAKIIGKHTSGSLVGSIKPFAGSSAPVGTLLCYGQAVSRTTYSALFAVVGTTYGSGDGSTTFNLPDLRGRIPAGKDDMGGSAANRLTSGGSGVNGAVLGASGGAETHTLTTAQLAAHNHGGGAHTHSAGSGITFITQTGGAGILNSGGAYGQQSDTGSANSTVINTEGSGSAHQNTQPTIVSNYVISYI